MNVLHIVEASFAGVGRHVLDLAAGQAANGHEVHVAYGPARESERFSAERKRMDNVIFHQVSMARTAGPHDVGALIRIAAMVRKQRPQVIHGHSTKGGLLARTVPTLLCGDLGKLRSTVARIYTPNAVYSMNPGLTRTTRIGVELIERMLSYRTDVVIAVSPEEQRHLLAIGVSPNRIAIVPNGIPLQDRPERGVVRAELGLPAQATVLGFVGRLDDQKNPLLLIDAFACVARNREDLLLSIVGAGPLCNLLRDRISALGLQGRVRLHGEQPGRRSMAAFDLFVLPSRYEGFPYVLIEAAQAGLPIVTTSEACSEQLDIDGRYGRVIPSARLNVRCSEPSKLEASKLEASEPAASEPEASEPDLLPVSPEAQELGRAIVATLDDSVNAQSRKCALESGQQFTVEAMVNAVEGLLVEHVKPSRLMTRDSETAR